LDHKQIALCFKSKRACNTQKINDRILNDDYLEKTLLIHTFDTYVNHSKITDAFTIQEKTLLTEQIGALMGTLERIQNLKLEGELYGNIAEIAAQVEALNAELSLGIERLPNLDFFENLELDCELDVFFETLAFILKNAALSFQSSFFKIKNQRKNRIRKDIKLLKENYANNSNEIFEKESELSNLIDIELKEELSLIKNFERLNDEKITPYFLNLAKTPQKNESIDTICDDNGIVFDEPEMRNNHIHSYYRDLYKKPNRVPDPNIVDRDNLSIEEFLGDAANHPEVLKSKLNENEKNFLDRPLGIDELDFSVKKVKKNSAPGGDGISNRFIQKNWNLLRVPLFKYATTCFEKGTLTNNFRSANVRLIPKKGDCTKIKNWRPISLLNCFYKIISRALAERLKQVMDKITQVGQKGYSSSKQCQEVLINIIDSIHTCKSNGKTGALISLDIRKAFDTISHDFLLKAYKFFNFGDYIIRWLQVIGTNRRACIILENGMYTKFFDLERGTAQGDTISPYIFNIGYQILLFKLNFDLQIEGFLEPPELPPDINLPASLSPEETVSIMTRKAFAFADDANVFSNLDRNSLLRVKTILENFGRLSGLECNVEKTTVMCINSDVPEFVREIGFTAVQSVTILGLEIEGDSGLFNNSLENICVKIQKNISVWKRFNLSLPGRICIAKTMLYSQINYLGCFLEIPPHFTKRMSDLITNFVCGEINIASKRLFLPVTMGGLGLFELDPFLSAQKCSWIQQAGDLNNKWKLILHFLSNVNRINIRKSLIDQSALPILFGILSSSEKISSRFHKTKRKLLGISALREWRTHGKSEAKNLAHVKFF